MRILAKTTRIFLSVIILGCGLVMPVPQLEAAQSGQAATVPLATACPLFQDDLDYGSLAGAIDRSVHYLERLPREKTFALCGEEYSAGRLIDSLLAFKRIIAGKPSPPGPGRSCRRTIHPLPGNGQTLKPQNFSHRLF